MAAGGAICYVNLDGAEIWSSGTKNVTMAGTAGGALRFMPFGHGARFENVAELTATVKVLAGTATDFDIRGSYYLQSSLGVAGVTDGTIDRDAHDFGNLSSPGTQAISPPFPSTASLRPVVIPTTAVAVGATTTATTLTMLGTATVNASIIRRK